MSKTVNNTQNSAPNNAISNKQQVFDLIVIGSGPSGNRAAMQGAKAGKRVLVVEEGSCLGGMCVHTGTVPSKSFRESVYRYSLGSQGILGQELEGSGASEIQSHSSVSGGITGRANAGRELPDMRRLLRRKERVVYDESQVIKSQLTRNKIEVFHGRARLSGKRGNVFEVIVEDQWSSKRFFSERVILAVGSHPVSPEHIRVDAQRVHDNDSILGITTTPQSMVVLGGGIIGCEYASMFCMLGTKVYVVDKRHEILAACDREIVKGLMNRFEQEDVEIILSTEALKVEVKDDKVEVSLSNGQILRVDCVLVAQGRKGNTEKLGLETVSLSTDERGLIKVDENFQTTVTGLYAVGDVVGAPALASTGMEQGRIACCHAFNLKEWIDLGSKMPAHFPFGVYTIPEIAMIGRNEEELIRDGVDYVAGKSRYSELARGQIVGDKWGLLKILVDRKNYQVLGVHIIGDSAADLIHIGQAVMSLGGDVRYFIRSVFNYPTLAEAYKTAAFHAYNQIKGAAKPK